MTRLNIGAENYDSYDAEDYRENSIPKPFKKSEYNRVEGAIRKLRKDKGYGFIAGDDGTDYFFIWAGLEKSTVDFKELELLDRVSFVPIQGDKGPKAIMVRLER
jgi:cold shock protein